MASSIISTAARERTRGEDARTMMTASRSLGAAVGAGIAVITAFLAFAIGQTDFLGLGIPAAAISGWLLGPQIRSQGGIAGPAIGMAVLSVAMADALVVLGSVPNLAAGSDVIAGFLGMWVIGFLFVGIPMLIVTTPCGIVWAVIVRKMTRDGSWRPLANQQSAA